MESDDTFCFLPLEIDPDSKEVSSPDFVSSALDTELVEMNKLHQSLLTLDTPGYIPPPPLPINPRRSAQITKLRDTGNTAFRKGSHAEAIKLYTFAIDMAKQRPLFEPAALVKEELAALFANRAQAYMSLQSWAEALSDANTSVTLKQAQNAKAYWRKGIALKEMGQLEEASEALENAIEWEGPDQELVGLKKEVDTSLERKARK